jgi:FMN phosphatase YigB (HAD superfamily)
MKLAEEAVHIGDDETKDYHGATQVGMKAILLSRSLKAPTLNLNVNLPIEFSKLPISRVSFEKPLFVQ